jgi:hypothetical protein
MLNRLPLVLAGLALGGSISAQVGGVELAGHGAPIGLSADGRIVAFWNHSTDKAHLWNAVDGFQEVAQGAFDVRGLSGDGRSLVGTIPDPLGTDSSYAGRWDAVNGWVSMYAPPGTPGCSATSFSNGLALDYSGGAGTITVRYDCYQSCAGFWVDLGVGNPAGYIELDPNTGPWDASGDSRATCISGNASTTGGWFADHTTGRAQPTVWLGPQQFVLAPGESGSVHAINHDGTVAVGQVSGDAFRWVFGEGLENFQLVTPSTWANDEAKAVGVSADGRTVLGEHGFDPFGGLNAAWIWTPETGAQRIDDLLAAEGVSLPGVTTLYNAYQLSADGRHATLGAQKAGGGVETYLVTLPTGRPVLETDLSEISTGAGGTQTMSLDAGVANAGNLYVLTGSASGTWPGFESEGLHLPLNIDAYTHFTLGYANVAIPGSIAFLDGAGRSGALFGLLPGSDPSLAGIHLWHAYAVFDPSLQPVGISNATFLRVTP